MGRSVEQRLADLEQHAWGCLQDRRDARRQVDHLIGSIAEVAREQRAYQESAAGDAERLERLKTMTWDNTAALQAIMDHLGIKPAASGASTTD